MGTIAVVGSVNMDLVNRVERLPKPGETVLGGEIRYFRGGKGANQAVAASLAGAKVIWAGAVGSDHWASELLQGLQDAEVQTDRAAFKPGATGLASIAVDRHGENSIIIAPGANDKLTFEDVAPLFAAETGQFDAVILQNEIPWAVTSAVLEAAGSRGIPVFFNPAPAVRIPATYIQYVHTLIVNEIEAEYMTEAEGAKQDRAREDNTSQDGTGLGIGIYWKKAEQLLAQGCRAVVVTLGDRGSVYADREGRRIATPAYPAAVLDTTGAGDTFVGALCAAWTEGRSPEEALAFASAAAALSVTREGAQSSMPTRSDIVAFMGRHRIISQPDR